MRDRFPAVWRRVTNLSAGRQVRRPYGADEFEVALFPAASLRGAAGYKSPAPTGRLFCNPRFAVRILSPRDGSAIDPVSP